MLLIEGGRSFDTPDKYFNRLTNRCQGFFDFRARTEICDLHQQVFNRPELRYQLGGIAGLSKTQSELLLMKWTLECLKERAEYVGSGIQRIFKITGRYQLSPLFATDVYEVIGDKYAFRQRWPSWLPPANQSLVADSWYSSRLWSFGPSHLDQTLTNFNDMLRDLASLMTQTYLDIEHLLFRYYGNKANTIELSHTHLMGNGGYNGALVYD